LSVTPRASALAPFSVRAFRFQWPADLSTSWAFEMETIILAWYVLVETESVFLLALFASLQYLGTLIAPFFGVIADRAGHGNVLSAMRGAYALLASVLMTFALFDALTPVYVFAIAAVMGMVRPSDMGMRSGLVGDTMPREHLMSAMGIQRTTSDSARVAGALTGAGLVATFGMGPAYCAIVLFYAASFVLTRKVARMGRRPAAAETQRAAPRPSPWRDFRAGAVYVWNTPHLLATMCLAFLVNLTAYPLVNGLLPYVAKEIYRTDQTGLGYLVAGFAGGALLGSIALSRGSGRLRPARMMLFFCGAWHVAMLGFAFMNTHVHGVVALMVTGFAQSLGMVPMAALLLRNSEPGFRGRIMGLRMLAIYGLPVGLLVAGPLIARFGYRETTCVYGIVGLIFVVAIGFRWREHLWRADAPANRR
jgi:predicted MFS family arabinose efflux permease